MPNSPFLLLWGKYAVCEDLKIQFFPVKKEERMKLIYLLVMELGKLQKISYIMKGCGDLVMFG